MRMNSFFVRLLKMGAPKKNQKPIRNNSVLPDDGQKSCRGKGGNYKRPYSKEATASNVSRSEMETSPANSSAIGMSWPSQVSGSLLLCLSPSLFLSLSHTHTSHILSIKTVSGQRPSSGWTRKLFSSYWCDILRQRRMTSSTKTIHCLAQVCVTLRKATGRILTCVAGWF